MLFRSGPPPDEPGQDSGLGRFGGRTPTRLLRPGARPKTEAAHSLCSHSLSHSLFLSLSLSSPSHLPLRSKRRRVLASPLRRRALDFPSSSWICSSSSSVLLHLIVEPLSDIVVILGLLILIPIDLQTSSSCFCCTTCWC